MIENLAGIVVGKAATAHAGVGAVGDELPGEADPRGRAARSPDREAVDRGALAGSADLLYAVYRGINGRPTRRGHPPSLFPPRGPRALRVRPKFVALVSANEATEMNLIRRRAGDRLRQREQPQRSRSKVIAPWEMLLYKGRQDHLGRSGYGVKTRRRWTPSPRFARTDPDLPSLIKRDSPERGRLSAFSDDREVRRAAGHRVGATYSALGEEAFEQGRERLRRMPFTKNILGILDSVLSPHRR
jgi:hypothetical protein